MACHSLRSYCFHHHHRIIINNNIENTKQMIIKLIIRCINYCVIQLCFNSSRTHSAKIITKHSHCSHVTVLWLACVRVPNYCFDMNNLIISILFSLASHTYFESKAISLLYVPITCKLFVNDENVHYITTIKGVQCVQKFCCTYDVIMK